MSAPDQPQPEPQQQQQPTTTPTSNDKEQKEPKTNKKNNNNNKVNTLIDILAQPGTSSNVLQYLRVKEYCRLSQINKDINKLLHRNAMWRLFYISSCPFYTPLDRRAVGPMLGWKELWKLRAKTGWRFSDDPDLCGECISVTQWDEKDNKALRKKNRATKTDASISFDVVSSAHLRVATDSPLKLTQLVLTQQGAWRGRHCFQVRVDNMAWGTSVGICKRHDDVPYPVGSYLQLLQDGSVSLYKHTRIEHYPSDRKYKQRYKANLKTGDIITLMLNLDQGNLSFFVNERHWVTVTHVTHANARPRSLEDLKQRFVDIKTRTGETRAKILLSNHASSKLLSARRFRDVVLDSTVQLPERGLSNAKDDLHDEFGVDHMGCILYDSGFHTEALPYLAREAKEASNSCARLRLLLHFLNTGNITRKKPQEQQQQEEHKQQQDEPTAASEEDASVHDPSEKAAWIAQTQAYLWSEQCTLDAEARLEQVRMIDPETGKRIPAPLRVFADLSMIFRRGLGVEKNNESAVSFYRQSQPYHQVLTSFHVHTEPLRVLSALYSEILKREQARQDTKTPEQIAEDIQHAKTMDQPFYFFVGFNCTAENKAQNMGYSVLKPASYT